MKGRKPVLLALTLLALCAGGCGGRGAGDAVEHGGGAGERSRVASERGRADAVRGRGSNGTGERGGR
ncbi:MAG: S1 family peptidase, partial [Rikenellaceae bacterium]|nr:S1 family peptidase [Rikenellaceae bacterium]